MADLLLISIFIRELMKLKDGRKLISLKGQPTCACACVALVCASVGACARLRSQVWPRPSLTCRGGNPTYTFISLFLVF